MPIVEAFFSIPGGGIDVFGNGVWTGGICDVPGISGAMAVDMAPEVTSGVLLALAALSAFFSAFFLALQFSVVCLPFHNTCIWAWCEQLWYKALCCSPYLCTSYT